MIVLIAGIIAWVTLFVIACLVILVGSLRQPVPVSFPPLNIEAQARLARIQNTSRPAGMDFALWEQELESR